jgi:hypothetical protein
VEPAKQRDAGEERREATRKEGLDADPMVGTEKVTWKHQEAESSSSGDDLYRYIGFQSPETCRFSKKNINLHREAYRFVPSRNAGKAIHPANKRHGVHPVRRSVLTVRRVLLPFHLLRLCFYVD